MLFNGYQKGGHNNMADSKQKTPLWEWFAYLGATVTIIKLVYTYLF